MGFYLFYRDWEFYLQNDEVENIKSVLKLKSK